MTPINCRDLNAYYSYEEGRYANFPGVVFRSSLAHAESIKVSKFPLKGHGVVATKDISTKQHICSITRPLLVALDTPRLKDTCYTCFKQAKDNHDLTLRQLKITDEDESPLKVCTGCRVVRFCDRDCQSQAWKLYHKHECPVFKALHPRVLPNNVRAVVRFLLQEKHDLLFPTMWEHVQSLQDHIDDLRNAGGARWENLVIMAQGAKEYSRTNVDFMAVLKLLCRLMVNGMTLTTTWGDPIGLFLHPMLSKINHACAPNAYVHMLTNFGESVYRSPCLINVAPLREIKAGEEIVLAYVDSNDHVESRQKQLREQYFFTCKCGKCEREQSSCSIPLSQPQQDAMKQIRGKVLSCIETAEVATSTGKRIESLRYAIHLMEQTQCWSVDMEPFPKAQHGLILAYIEASRFDYALSHAALQHFDIDPVVYADYAIHPTRNVHTFLFIRLMTLLLGGHKWSLQTMGLENYGLNLKWWRAKLYKELLAEFEKATVFPDLIFSLRRERETSTWDRVTDADLENAEKQEKAMQGMRRVIDVAYERNKRWTSAV